MFFSLSDTKFDSLRLDLSDIPRLSLHASSSYNTSQSEMSDHNTVDVLVVGGGPSGLAAALCLSRACYKTVIFDSGSYRNEQAHHMHMFPTWDHQDPKAYRASARKELQERYDTVRFVDLAVTAVIRDKDGSGGFKAVDSSGEDWYGKKLVLASGVKDIFPDIPGYDECWVKGM